MVLDQIIEHYAVPDSKITSIPIGAGPGAAPIGPDEARQELASLGIEVERPYLLTVGNLQPRKNLVRLLESFEELIVTRGYDINLLIVGPRHYRAEDAVRAASAVVNRVHFTGYVTDRQLAACYALSKALIFPSLYEGFGLPALEAMAHGVAIACSDAGSLPEVCGDAAVLFDPRSVEAMTDAADRLLRDEALRAQLVAAGRERVKLFSWARTAALTLEVYETVVSSK